ncbi:hypothetical protein NKL58_11425 [Mesorhizobium australicum]|nr:YjhX family toxin [Mesorhizobium sp. LNHC209A00]
MDVHFRSVPDARCWEQRILHLLPQVGRIEIEKNDKRRIASVKWAPPHHRRGLEFVRSELDKRLSWRCRSVSGRRFPSPLRRWRCRPGFPRPRARRPRCGA